MLIAEYKNESDGVNARVLQVEACRFVVELWDTDAELALDQVRLFKTIEHAIEYAKKIVNINDHAVVAPGCPKCREARMDYLVWIDDDSVRCVSCGAVYKSQEVTS